MLGRRTFSATAPQASLPRLRRVTPRRTAPEADGDDDDEAEDEAVKKLRQLLGLILLCRDGLISAGSLASANSFRKISSMLTFFLADVSTNPTGQSAISDARHRSSPVSTTRSASRSHLLPTMMIGVIPELPAVFPVPGQTFASVDSRRMSFRFEHLIDQPTDLLETFPTVDAVDQNE